MSFDHAARIDRLFESMPSHGVDVVLLSVGADMPRLIGYETTSFERLTMAVLRIGEVPNLVVPKLDAPRVDDLGGVFEVVPWDEMMIRSLASPASLEVAPRSPSVTQPGAGSHLRSKNVSKVDFGRVQARSWKSCDA